VEHSALSYPVLIWGADYIFLAKDMNAFERTPKSQFDRLRNQARKGKTKLLDSNGMYFKVVDELIISSRHPFFKWFCEFRTAPLLSEGRKVGLEEFKTLVIQAVRVRQRGEYDSNFLDELMGKLPFASSYRDALACVPKDI
jgi:hypothetical protein